MDLQHLASKVDVNVDIVKQHLSTFRLNVEDVEWKTLEVPHGETVTLDANRNEFGSQLKMLETSDLDEAREWVGVPQRIFKPRIRPDGLRFSPIRPSPSLSVINPNLLHSISPTARLESLAPEKRSLLFSAARNLVFGNVKDADVGTPLYQAARDLVLKRKFPSLFFPDILVGPGATLNIASSVSLVFAYRIKIWKGGKIVTPRYSFVSFSCYSVEGRIQ